MMLIPLARQRDEGVPRGPGDPPHQISRRSVFHGISRAERPSQQSRKTNPGSRSGKPGTDGTASEFPAKSAGNPWQSRQSPEGTVAGGAVFRKLSRAEPTGLCAPKKKGRAPAILWSAPTYVTELGYLCRRLPNDSVRVSARIISEPVTEPSIRLLTVVLLIAFNGFFAGAEVSLLSVRHSRLRQMAAEGNAGGANDAPKAA